MEIPAELWQHSVRLMSLVTCPAKSREHSTRTWKSFDPHTNVLNVQSSFSKLLKILLFTVQLFALQSLLAQALHDFHPPGGLVTFSVWVMDGGAVSFWMLTWSNLPRMSHNRRQCWEWCHRDHARRRHRQHRSLDDVCNVVAEKLGQKRAEKTNLFGGQLLKCMLLSNAQFFLWKINVNFFNFIPKE